MLKTLKIPNDKIFILDKIIEAVHMRIDEITFIVISFLISISFIKGVPGF
jgi:hypothetical protein